MYTNPYTPSHSQVAQEKARNTGKSFANFHEPFSSGVWHEDINRNHPASQDTLPRTGRMRAYFKVKIMCDSLRVKTDPCLPFSFITHHLALNAMSLFRIRTQSQQSRHTPTISKTTCTTSTETACAHDVPPTHPPVYMMYHPATRHGREDSCGRLALSPERGQCESATYLDLPVSDLCA